MAKTTKIMRLAIEQYAEALAHTEELIRVKATVPVENQADHVRNGTPELWIARLEGQSVMLEHLLHRSNCYHGFFYVTERKRQDETRYAIGTDHPDFAEWRRDYIIVQ